ncbi:Uncharacterised protein [Escherichia coli]|uniref:Uncharacterized protein n=1 Tax=Escherichia coli TaxID=562 RepID=A0A376SBL2_ECOLX|nr:Uncharacterised protein [Escherichia coli]
MKQSQARYLHVSIAYNLVQRYALLLPFSGFAELAEFAVVPATGALSAAHTVEDARIAVTIVAIIKRFILTSFFNSFRNAAIILGEHEMRNQRATLILKGLSYSCSYYRKKYFSLTIVGNMLPVTENYSYIPKRDVIYYIDVNTD